MTRDTLANFIEEKYGFRLMDFQKEALWNFYQKAKGGDLTEYFWMGRQNCKRITYEIMRDLLKMMMEDSRAN